MPRPVCGRPGRPPGRWSRWQSRRRRSPRCVRSGLAGSGPSGTGRAGFPTRRVRALQQPAVRRRRPVNGPGPARPGPWHRLHRSHPWRARAGREARVSAPQSRPGEHPGRRRLRRLRARRRAAGPGPQCPGHAIPPDAGRAACRRRPCLQKCSWDMAFKSKRGPSAISRVLLKLVRSGGFPKPENGPGGRCIQLSARGRSPVRAFMPDFGPACRPGPRLTSSGSGCIYSLGTVLQRAVGLFFDPAAAVSAPCRGGKHSRVVLT